MSSTRIAVDVPEEQVRVFDEIAESVGSNREAVILEAFTHYLSDYTLEQEIRIAVEEGIRQADAGEFVDHEEIVCWLESKKQRADEAA